MSESINTTAVIDQDTTNTLDQDMTDTSDVSKAFNTSLNSYPDQAQLDACKSFFDKFTLLKPEKLNDLTGRELSTIFTKVTRPFCCYNVSAKRWMFYNGKNWELDIGDAHILGIAKKFSYELLCYAGTVSSSMTDPFFIKAYSLSEPGPRRSLINDSIDNNYVTEEMLDTNPYLINLQNGTFDLLSMELRPHSYKDLITRLANVEFIPGAHSTILDNFMNSIFPDHPELIDYVYRVLGLCLSGDVSEEAFFVFLGETTRNGKSTLLNTVAYMLGGPRGYAMTCDIGSLAKRKYYNASAPSSDLARLKGARFVIASEPPMDFQLDDSRIKSLTGGDTITARMLHANNIEFMPEFKLFIATNHRPQISDDSVLNSNRMRIIPFSVHFDENHQNKHLKKDLREPTVLSALLFNCLKGWHQYRKAGLQDPDIVKETVAEYKTSGQVFSLFFQESFIECPNNMIALSDFYPRYVQWCTDNDFVVANKSDIIKIMKSKGIFKATGTINKKTHRNVLFGYAYKPVKEDIVYDSSPNNMPLTSIDTTTEEEEMLDDLKDMYTPEEQAALDALAVTEESNVNSFDFEKILNKGIFEEGYFNPTDPVPEMNNSQIRSAGSENSGCPF